MATAMGENFHTCVVCRERIPEGTRGTCNWHVGVRVHLGRVYGSAAVAAEGSQQVQERAS